jgi:exopolysaccharide biosynthesis polyprenyl glycosylphosphotransferase
MIFGKKFLASRIAIVGIEKEAQQFGLHVSKSCQIQCELVGFVKPDSSDRQRIGPSLTMLGSLDELPTIVDEKDIDEVIIATRNIPREKLIKTLSELSDKGISCKVMPQIYEAVIGNIMTTPVGEMATVLIAPVQEKFYWYRGVKRIVDLIAATVISILALPLIPFIVLLIKIASEGPMLIRQKRVGLYGRHFILYKFRTMYRDAEKSGPVWAEKDDPRITPVGRFLRKTRLDELPQLFNVFLNDMSLVGPRPERPYFVSKLKNEIPFHLERLAVKPGITGWAQITCPYADSVEDSREKFIHDIFYIKNISLALDIFIFLKTILIILQEKGAQ